MQTIHQLDLGGVNAYLLENNDKFALVDCGGPMFMDKVPDMRTDKLLGLLSSHGVTPENLSLILLTHGDIDHSYNAKLIHERYDAPIAMSAKDTFLVTSPEPDCYKVNCHYRSLAFRIVFRLMGKKIAALMAKIYSTFPSFIPDILLTEEMDLSDYGFEGLVYETPGHTPGSVCIFHRGGDLICGDLFANNKKPTLAPNAEDFSVLRDSVGKVSYFPVTKVYPGHGEPYTI